MAKAKKLKVYRTAIGFHDAYVAAPSQKAALEAWGSDTNLFARGAAELVTDPALTKAPLERPGEVIKVSRGGAAEQIRALGEAHRSGTSMGTRGKPAPKAKRRDAANDDVADEPDAAPAKPKKAKRGPRPSRAAVDKAERALERAESKHREQVAALKAEEEAIAQRRRKLEAGHRAEHERLEQRVETAREDYSAAMAKWAED